MAENNVKSTPAWLEDAVFYEIYPQSYYDANGDGIGDIPGILAKLDYIQSLGVTGIWLNPCFVSPFQDAGYDVADYYQVAPRYGTNENLKHLFNEAHNRGIRILLDLVPGHTSIEHPWFKESCKPERNQYSDYYIWTDSVWKWEVPGYKVISGFSQRNGCYICNFFYSQPALNYGFSCPDPSQPWQQSVDAPGPQQVRRELKNIMRYWLEMGASGFRVDMAGSLVKADPGNRETIKLWQEIRSWLDGEFPEACLISEWGRPSEAIPAGFHMDFTLPFGMPGYTALLRKHYDAGPGSDPYGFSFFESVGHGNIMEFLDDYLHHYNLTRGKGQIAIPSGNHDMNPRLSMRRSTDELELVFLFLLTMPGVPFIYYGDEIGMRSFENLPSKESGYGRTGARTPMQWSDELNAGFSIAKAERLYLPIDPDPGRPNVKQQKKDPHSLLQRVNKLVAIRKTFPALQASASFDVLYADAGKYPLIYKRSREGDVFIIAVNPAAYPVEVEINALSASLPQTIYGSEGVFTQQNDNWKISLSGISGGIYQVMKQ
ncbi:MAG: alpha-amylase family glycosyl hydrolase [Anaerolineales bacterium]